MNNNDLIDEAYDGLLKYMEDGDHIFELEGPIMTTVLLQDGTYRKKTLDREEFWLSGVRVGTRDVIFSFQFNELSGQGSVYNGIEVVAKEMDNAFPLFLGTMQSWATKKFVDQRAETGLVGEAVSKRVTAIQGAKSVSALGSICVNFQKIDLSTEAEDVTDSLASLPTFGMF